MRIADRHPSRRSRCRCWRSVGDCGAVVARPADSVGCQRRRWLRRWDMTSQTSPAPSVSAVGLPRVRTNRDSCRRSSRRPSCRIVLGIVVRYRRGRCRTASPNSVGVAVGLRLHWPIVRAVVDIAADAVGVDVVVIRIVGADVTNISQHRPSRHRSDDALDGYGTVVDVAADPVAVRRRCSGRLGQISQRSPRPRCPRQTGSDSRGRSGQLSIGVTQTPSLSTSLAWPIGRDAVVADVAQSVASRRPV